jgi:hypothetical protein
VVDVQRTQMTRLGLFFSDAPAVTTAAQPLVRQWGASPGTMFLALLRRRVEKFGFGDRSGVSTDASQDMASANP